MGTWREGFTDTERRKEREGREGWEGRGGEGRGALSEARAQRTMDGVAPLCVHCICTIVIDNLKKR